MTTDEENKNERTIDKIANVFSIISSSWPIVASISYLISICFGLLYWNEYYSALGVSYGSYLRLEDLVVGIFRLPVLLISTFIIFSVAYFTNRVLPKNKKIPHVLSMFIFTFAIASIPMMTISSAKYDAGQVVIGKTPYHDVKFTGKNSSSLERVVFAGGMVEFLVFYSPTLLRSVVVSRATVASIISSKYLIIDESRNASSWMNYIGPNLYDEEKLKLRGYETWPHRDGGILPLKDLNGKLIKKNKQ